MMDRNWAPARDMAEACGGLVCYDAQADQAVVVPPLAPPWKTLDPLVQANRYWRTEMQLSQARVDYIWAQALRRKVDPRLLLAILPQEGTGSFNTNPDNAADYNGNGPDANWIRDTDRAVNLVAGKLFWYATAVKAGFREAAGKLGLEGSPIQFVNWPGPIANNSPTWGVYAQHGEWWRGVTRFFEEMGGSVRLLADYWAKDVRSVTMTCTPITDQPGMCSDPSGKLPVPGVVTRIA